MKFNVQTIWSMAVQNAAFIGTSYTPASGTTLNEKFNVVNSNVSNTDIPKLNVLTIGVDSNLNVSTSVGLDHSSVDAALFNHIPFKMVPTSQTYSPTSVSNYRLKSIKTVNGVDYNVWYGMKLSPSSDQAKLLSIKLDNGIATFDDYAPQDNPLLNPTQESLIDVGNIDTDDNVVLSKSLPISLDSTTLTDISNSLTILYGDNSKPITELGLCTSIDDGIEVSYTQVAYFYNRTIDIKYLIDNNHIYDKAVDVGGFLVLNK